MITELVTTPPENALAFIARPTPQLRAAIRHQQDTLAPSEFADLLAVIGSVFEKFTAKLREFRPGVERGTALHAMMDRELEAAANQAISCREGCSGCCHYEVEITSDEAELLKTVVQEGNRIDYEQLEEQASRERKAAEWSHFWNPRNRCVFLGETGACQVYADRPAICRKHLVVSPASACTTPGAAVAPVQVLMAEILLSAATSLDGAAPASLPKMLRTALAADGRPGARGLREGRPVTRALPPGAHRPGSSGGATASRDAGVGPTGGRPRLVADCR